jgi:hypothetical protein
LSAPLPPGLVRNASDEKQNSSSSGGPSPRSSPCSLGSIPSPVRSEHLTL